MLPVNLGGHSAYQNTFVFEFLKLFPDPFVIPKDIWDIIVKFWYLDLSQTDIIMQDYYSLHGKPASRFPSCLLRSYLLSIALNVTSITKWCGMLKITPLYAILSGFPVDDTPGVGTFYDFFNRLWQSDNPNYISQIKHKKVKAEKGKKHGDKTPCDTNSAASKLLPFLERFSLPNTNPFYFFGYHLYMFVASDSINDLPVFPLLERASRHDMLSFLHAFFSMRSYLPEFHIEKLLLDAAHDSYPVYDYCRENGITPFIDLNPGHTGHFKYKDDFTIGEDGVPVCQMGLRMHHDGVEKSKHREKYRCPLANRKDGCKCKNPCSDSKYGRTVHVQQKDNPRLFNIPSRDSNDWKLEYNRRTSVERSNKREKVDYKLEDGRHRSSKMWYCRLYAIMMLQHLDAWKTPTRVDTIFTFTRIATIT